MKSSPEFELFWRDYTTEYLGWIAKIVREEDPKGLTHVNNHLLFSNLPQYDFPQWMPFLSTLGASIHAAWHLGYFERQQYTMAIAANCDIIRSAAEPKPFWVTELQRGTNIFSGFDPLCPSEDDIAQWLWTCIGSGAERIVFWTLNARASVAEAGEWGMVTFQDEPTDRLTMSGNVAKVLLEENIFFEKAKTVKSESEILIFTRRKILNLCDEIRYETSSAMRGYMDNIISGGVLVLILSAVICLIIFLLICVKIIKPIKELQQLSLEIGEKGMWGKEEVELVDGFMKRVNPKDEMGDLVMAYREMGMRCNNSYLELRQKMKEVEDLSALKFRVTSVVSHELRTPLTAIKEGIALVSDGSLGQVTQEQKEFLGIARRNVDRLVRFINHVLDFSKLTDKSTVLDLKMCGINRIIESVVEINGLILRKKGLYLKSRIQATEGMNLKLDSDRVTQVLTNLIHNAGKFTDKGGVTVTTTRDDKSNFMKICVEDTGIGIKEEDISKLFQPFVQITDRKKSGGTGLGLTICREIIEQLGGLIWVESEFGKGSNFCFVLPVKERRGGLKD